MDELATVTQHAVEKGPNFHFWPASAPLVRETEVGVGQSLTKRL